MSGPATFFLTFFAGILLGFGYFGGLWLTIRSLPSARMPGLVVLCSLFVRLGLVLAGFYWVMGGRWECLLACLAGFVLARSVIVAKLRAPASGPSSPGGGAA